MDNKNLNNKKVSKYNSQEIFYIVMSVFIGLSIILLFYIGISHIVHATNWTPAESVNKSFYVVVSIFAFLIIGLFGFVEYLMVKLLLNSCKNKNL
ncbi:MAG TPA: hypothetical protein GX695_02075 [Acholeplasmataceae bacterium]|nr:hypothetical protein [Acholeplasmataceae bacterium]